MQRLYFYYREQLHVISKEEYHALDLPVDTGVKNGNIVMVKFSYDDEKSYNPYLFLCGKGWRWSYLREYPYGVDFGLA